jgi:hypothetical protein
VRAVLVSVLFVLTACASTAKKNGAATLHCVMVDNLCELKASVNGRPVWLVLDTGSSYSALDADRAESFGVHFAGSGSTAAPAKGADNTYRIASGVKIQVETVTLDDETVIALPFSYVAERVGHPTDGTLGSNLFNKFIVEIDYQAGTVNVRDPSIWDPTGFGELLPLTIESGTPFISAQVALPDGSLVTGRFLIDSGQVAGGLLLTESFVRQHPAITEGQTTRAAPPIKAVGGELHYNIGHVTALQIGAFQLKNVPTIFPRQAQGVYAREDVAGAIGADVLARFHVVFDYPNARVFLKPTPWLDAEFAIDRTGLQLSVKPPDYERFRVTGVIDHSPAGVAGLKAQDVIVKIDDVRPSSLAEAQSLLRHAKGSVALQVERDGNPQTVNLGLSE